MQLNNLVIGDKEIQAKILEICHYLKSFKSIIVAFSGGIDSTLVAKLSQLAIGKENTLAITAVSPSLAKRDLEDAKSVAQKLELRHILLAAHEINNPSYQKNHSDRCFHCKNHLYSLLKEYADSHGYQCIANGTNHTDRNDFRPGLQAAEKFSIFSPLLKYHVSKQMVRRIAQALDIPIWDKAASPCLSSRIPYGERIDVEKLKQIEQAEQILHELGFSNFRVRHHGNLARIEVNRNDFVRFVEENLRMEIERKIKKLNFQYVCLDLIEFRSGRLNDLVPTTL